MKTGAQIVAELEASLNKDETMPHIIWENWRVVQRNWPTIKAALLAYEPESALRAIFDKAEYDDVSGHYYIHVTDIEFEAARAELDQLEDKP
jgi:hypothetical protein